MWFLKNDDTDFANDVFAARGYNQQRVISEIPFLSEIDTFYFTAFWVLNTCRSSGMSLGHIPWNVIVEYGDRQGLDDENIDLFVAVITSMDNAYLKYNNEKVEKDSKRKK